MNVDPSRSERSGRRGRGVNSSALNNDVTPSPATGSATVETATSRRSRSGPSISRSIAGRLSWQNYPDLSIGTPEWVRPQQARSLARMGAGEGAAPWAARWEAG